MQMIDSQSDPYSAQPNPRLHTAIKYAYIRALEMDLGIDAGTLTKIAPRRKNVNPIGVGYFNITPSHDDGSTKRGFLDVLRTKSGIW